MLRSIFGNSFFMVATLVFVAVLLLLEAAYVAWRAHRGPRAVKLRHRLQALSVPREVARQTVLLRQRSLSELPALERVLQTISRAHSLDRMIIQSGLEWKVSRVLLATVVLGAGTWAFVTTGLHEGLATGAFAGLVAGSLPLAFVRYKRGKRLGKIERQLPDALDLITRALRAGHAFSAALKMAGEEMPDPIGSELAMVHDEVNFGVTIDRALGHFSERVPLTDLRYFVVAVLIQRESGGNLTEILTNLSQLVRERLKFMGKVRVLSSEGRLSAWILGLMPFFLAGVLNLANPEFMRPLWTDPIGITIVKYLLVLMAVGALIMRKLVKIRY